ncbi:MAG: hypothetical protein KIS78_08025 [Labilithrix sp.]|nr:hypothetical protein [Labilithrix sp.]
MSAPLVRCVLPFAACFALVPSACDSESSRAAVRTGADASKDVAGGGADAPSAPSSPGSSSGAPDPEPGPSGPAQVAFVGRFDTSDPAGPKASWPGSRILTRFSGTRVSVTLKEQADTWMDGAPSYWEVVIDGGAPKVLAMIADEQPRVFALAEDLPAGEHEVELYKRSETQTGVTQYLGFDFHGGAPLPPPPRKTRHIEAMADSYGTGYGVVTLDAPDLKCDPGPDHAGRHQNFRLAWPSLLGARFDAEVEGTVYSGKGLTRGIWPTDTDGLVHYYNRANPNPALAHAPPLFDLTSWVPDAIVLVQGTVDNGHPNFRNVYRDFVVDQLRARAPAAHIFLVVPGRIARQMWIDTVHGVASERAAAGDLKVHAVVPGEEQPHEMTGCGYHGSPAYHQRIADEIGAVMAEKLGW